MRKMLALTALIAVGLVAVACSSSDRESEASADGSDAAAKLPIAGSTNATVPTDNPAEKLLLEPQVPELVDPTPVPSPTPLPTGAEEAPRRLTIGWKTDFSKHSVPFSEIRSGGVPRDGIRPLDNPIFEPASGDHGAIRDNDPVISLEINGEAKAYPLAILIWHEIVNDEVGGVPVTVTYCPLCNTAIVFDRTVNGQLLDFGTTGNLRNSDLVMWDRQTESWWQQVTGEAIVGSMTGTKLKFIPAPLVSWWDFRDSFVDGQVLSRNTGLGGSYDTPPYSGYDNLDNRPFLFSGQIDSRLATMERIVGLTIGDEVVAYPFMLLESIPVVNDTVGGQDIAIFYVGDTLSVFNNFGSTNREVGSTGVFDANLDGRKLIFQFVDDKFVDDQTGSTWNILGQAVDGPLEGSTLDQVAHANHFWFAWAAFYPDTDIRTVEALAAN